MVSVLDSGGSGGWVNANKPWLPASALGVFSAGCERLCVADGEPRPLFADQSALYLSKNIQGKAPQSVDGFYCIIK